MIQRKGQSITGYCYYTNNKRGVGSLTVTCSVAAPDGSALVTSGSATAVNNTLLPGLYKYTLAGASTGTSGDYVFVFSVASGTGVDQEQIPALWVVGPTWVEFLDGAITAIPAAAWNYLTSAATTVGSLGKLLSDNINATIGSRASVNPDNSSIAAIKVKTDSLPADPASNTVVNTRLAGTAYTAPDNAGIIAIKARTDLLPLSPASEGTAAAARTAAESVDGKLTSPRAAKLDHLDASVSSRLSSGADPTDGLTSILAYVDEIETRLTSTRAALLDNLTRLDVPVSTASQVVKLLHGPYEARADADSGTLGTTYAVAGDILPMSFSLRDASGDVIPLLGATVTALLTDHVGTTVEAPDVEVTEETYGRVVVTVPLSDPGRYTLTIQRAVGEDDVLTMIAQKFVVNRR